MTTLRALARVVVAGVAYAEAVVRNWFDAELAFWRLSRSLAARRLEDQRRRARAVGYRGPIDLEGFWAEDLATGTIDHDGNPREPKAT